MSTAELAAAGAVPRTFAVRRHLDAAFTVALAIAAGFIAVIGPYSWAEEWQLYGFDWKLWDYYAWQLLPFALVSAAIPLRLLRGTLARASVLALLAAYVASAWHVTQTFSGTNPAFDWLPGVLSCAVVTVTAGDVLFRRWATAARLYTRLAWIGTGIAVLALGRTLPIENQPEISTFVVLFTSIVIEALPFVLFGAAVSAALEVLVPAGWFARLSGKPLRVQIPAAVASGFAFPVCECGSVPVARRLILRGLHPTAGLAFMLAAPIVNPVVLVSTAIAFQGRNAAGMVGARAILGLVLAVGIALVIGRRNDGALLRVRNDGLSDGHAHDHDHGHACSVGDHHHAGRLRRWSDHISADFFFMGKFVVAGGALAAAAQTVIPTSFYESLAGSALVGALVLMLAAFMLSLCSEADAFVALSFTGFPVSAQLAFLVFGPVLDIKLAMLYRATFGRGFLIRLALLLVPIVLISTTIAGGLIS